MGVGGGVAKIHRPLGGTEEGRQSPGQEVDMVEDFDTDIGDIEHKINSIIFCDHFFPIAS